MIKFEEYQNLIYKRASCISKKYHYEYDECLAIGYEIFVNSVKTFDETKGAKFSTYLYTELNRIADEVKKQMRMSQYELLNDIPVDADDCVIDEIIESRVNPDNTKLFELAKKELSYEGYKLLQWITSFSWQNWDAKRVATVPTKKLAIKGCGFKREVVESAWSECESFWNKEGWRVA